MLADEYPETRTSPLVGRSAMWMRRSIVDLPAPLWPVMKQNSPLRMCRDTSSRASPERGYSFVTWLNEIIASWQADFLRAPAEPPVRALRSWRMGPPSPFLQYRWRCRGPARCVGRAVRG